MMDAPNLRAAFKAYLADEGHTLEDLPDDAIRNHIEWFVASAADGEIAAIDEDTVNDFPEWEAAVARAIA